MRTSIVWFFLLLLTGPVFAQDCGPPPAPLLIRNVRLPTVGLAEAQAVLVEQGRISRIGAEADMLLPPRTERIDGGGRYLLPGLIDAHVHVWDEAELSAYLAAGVTAVRNASGMPFHLEFAAAIEAGCLEGPRLLTTGPILNGQGPNTQVNHQLVHDAAQARAAVRAQQRQGFRHLKLYSNLSPQAYRAIVAEARRLGLSLMGHSPEGRRLPGIPQRRPFEIGFDEVLADGFVSLEHIESIVWHGLRDRLDEGQARRLARRIAARGVAVTATLVAHHNLVRVAQTRGAHLRRPGVEWLNPFVTEFEQEDFERWSRAGVDARAPQDRFYARVAHIFQQEGVTLLAGSDAGIFTNVPGLSLLDELELLVQAGLTPRQALDSATRHPARVLGLPGGELRVGAVADLILVDGDPTTDIRHLRRLVGLVRAGQWLDETALARLRRQAAATDRERSKQRIEAGLAAQGSALSH